MNFQAHQVIARHSTVNLVVYLLAGTLGLVLTISGLASAYFFVRFGTEVGWRVAVIVAVLSAIGIGLASIAKGARVRNGGGPYVAASLGGFPIDLGNPDYVERQLINVTEEIAIASGMPVPELFVLPDEPGINAFAAGWNPDNSVIGVTRGALYYLSRNELQAVVAHEFSHIANGDARVKTRVIAWLYGITSVGLFGKTILRSTLRAPHPIAIAASVASGTVLVAIGAIGTLFARQMQVAVNREREHLADASAIEFTRNPDDLAGALLKIGALGQVRNAIRSPHAQETCHLFFESPFEQPSATHPPLRQRIRLLLPSWDFTFPALQAMEQTANVDMGVTIVGSPLPDVGIPGISNLGSFATNPVENTLQAGVLLETLGDKHARPNTTVNRETRVPVGSQIAYASRLLNAIPDAIRESLHTSQGAVAAILGLTISQYPETRESELLGASELTGFPARELDVAAAMINSLDRPLHLPAIEIALGTLRSEPAELRAAVTASVDELVESSDDIDLFRWLLRRVVRQHLHDANESQTPQGDLALEDLRQYVGVMYALVAAYNSAGADQIGATFVAAHEAAGLAPPAQLPGNDEIAIARIDQALDELSKLSIESRKLFVKGAVAAIELDTVTSSQEAELVRVIADALRVPIPPLIPLF